MKEIILNKLTELFISKNKTLTPEIAKVWVTKLCEKFQPENICKAIDEMIWSPDDFPTLGKIADHISRIKNDGKKLLFDRILAGELPKPDGWVWNIDVLNSDKGLYQKRLKEFQDMSNVKQIA